MAGCDRVHCGLVVPNTPAARVLRGETEERSRLMEYLQHILVIFALYVTLVTSLDLLAGHAGLLSTAHAGFYGLGAYTSALFMIHLGAPFLAGVLAGMTVAALISFIISLP